MYTQSFLFPFRDFFRPEAIAHPLVVAYGIGVDSTGMLIGMRQRDIIPDLILAADTGNEKDGTYAYISIIQEWLRKNGFPPLIIVRYTPAKTRHGAYHTLGQNCLRNATLPSLAFGYKSCSLKWKVAAQNKYCSSWQPAIEAWAAGNKVTKAIGYDCSPQDTKRYADARRKNDPHYNYVYPLQQWGWDRERCEVEITKAGLPVPPKSACFFCPSAKPEELHSLPAWQLKYIIIMEARARPYLRAIRGLWRNGTKGTKTGRPLPARMTDYIRAKALLPTQQVQELEESTPTQLGIEPAILDKFLELHLEGHRP